MTCGNEKRDRRENSSSSTCDGSKTCAEWGEDFTNDDKNCMVYCNTIDILLPLDSTEKETLISEINEARFKHGRIE